MAAAAATLDGVTAAAAALDGVTAAAAALDGVAAAAALAGVAAAAALGGAAPGFGGRHRGAAVLRHDDASVTITLTTIAKTTT